MNEVRYLEVTAEENGQRLDNYLLRVLKGVPRSHVYRIIRSGEVRVNKGRAKATSRIICGDRVRIPPVRMSASVEISVSDGLTANLLERILYEDDSLLVLNKPAGIAVHGGSGLSLGVIEALRKIRHETPYLELVHRLDKETSGCLLIAKKRSMLRAIQMLLASRDVHKEYWALLANSWQGASTVCVDVALQKNILQSGERIVVVSDAGKASLTKFKLMENYPASCFVAAYPETGRTHQIRVHGAHIGHAILGDAKYSDGKVSKSLSVPIKRLYLHARAIRFTLNDRQYEFLAPLDDEFQQAILGLRGHG